MVKLIIDYYSKYFGWVQMDITNVEEPPLKETTEYLRKLKRKRDEKHVINNSNNEEKSIY